MSHPQCLTCTRTRRRTHLMCPGCWALVPEPIQTEIYRTWTRGSIRQSPEWTAAVDAATAAVRAHRTQPEISSSTSTDPKADTP